MQLSFTEKKNIRKSFGKLKESLSIPNLIEVQKNSYKELTEFNAEAFKIPTILALASSNVGKFATFWTPA